MNHEYTCAKEQLKKERGADRLTCAKQMERTDFYQVNGKDWLAAKRMEWLTPRYLVIDISVNITGWLEENGRWYIFIKNAHHQRQQRHEDKIIIGLKNIKNKKKNFSNIFEKF